MEGLIFGILRYLEGLIHGGAFFLDFNGYSLLLSRYTVIMTKSINPREGDLELRVDVKNCAYL